MKKLIILVLIAMTAWYGWKHRESLLHPVHDNEAVIVNAADHGLQRFRVTVDGQTMVREEIEPGASSTLPFHVAHDSDFQLDWQWRGREGRPTWRGGLVTAGAPLSRTTLTVSDDGSVTVASAPLVTASR